MRILKSIYSAQFFNFKSFKTPLLLYTTIVADTLSRLKQSSGTRRLMASNNFPIQIRLHSIFKKHLNNLIKSHKSLFSPLINILIKFQSSSSQRNGLTAKILQKEAFNQDLMMNSDWSVLRRFSTFRLLLASSHQDASGYYRICNKKHFEPSSISKFTSIESSLFIEALPKKKNPWLFSTSPTFQFYVRLWLYA